MTPVAITGLVPDEINSTFSIKEKFRGKQIFRWIANGVESFSDMTNLPQNLRNRLNEEAVLRCSAVAQVLKDPDRTIKLQVRLFDDRCIVIIIFNINNLNC